MSKRHLVPFNLFFSIPSVGELGHAESSRESAKSHRLPSEVSLHLTEELCESIICLDINPQGVVRPGRMSCGTGRQHREPHLHHFHCSQLHTLSGNVVSFLPLLATLFPLRLAVHTVCFPCSKRRRGESRRTLYTGPEGLWRVNLPHSNR